MFTQLVTVVAVALMFSAQVNAHAAIAPALGVHGNPVRTDVQRPSTAQPCGTVNIAMSIDNATPVVAQADGSFVVTVTNFNPGADGSRSVSFVVDPVGTGKNFVAGTITQNGVAAPKTVGSDQVTAVLPPGTKCTGGALQNLCLASFKTTAGFGNCVIVQQDTTTASTAGCKAATAPTGVVSAVVADTSSAAPTSSVASTTTADNNTVVAAEAPLHRRQAGTRAARALQAGFQARFAKRDFLDWIWA
ncbi:hypothetical protein J132_01063 [Termitomyces sp. J132]|nr:hypothetical protein H2248_012045 [Termitomyces sp. 'cryptogamus']KNZ78284.1 hypothetical protein J132_01063 [Termitomyces sp. J132]